MQNMYLLTLFAYMQDEKVCASKLTLVRNLGYTNNFSTMNQAYEHSFSVSKNLSLDAR